MIVGLLGVGAIGSFLARELSRDPDVAEVLAYDLDAGRVGAATSEARKVRAATAEEILSRADVVVEAASQAAAREYVPRALRAGKDVVVLSVGALADAVFLQEVTALAAAHRGRLHVPSGAVGAIDALKAARLAGLREVEIETRKRPETLGRPAGFSGVVFEGNAVEAAARFPANINVAVTLGLAGLGPERTRVRIVADPSAPGNVHRVRYRGDFGEVVVSLENRPHPDNPKTSMLAAYSALALIRELGARVRVGT
ncbi:MAG TPA: aspartate dehydrogenase [Thermoplasmata archaeon]|nr:aspartate dehydrogenase [Thermoplasmata archaeon]